MKALYKKCNKHKKITAVVIMMSLLAVVGCLFYFNRVPSKAIAKYQTGIANGHGVAFYNDAVPEETAEKGTAENPFVVLELLSNKSLMEFGWLVEGCEPVPKEFMQLTPKITSISSHANLGKATQVAHWSDRVYKDELSAYDDPAAWTEYNYPVEEEKVVGDYYASFLYDTGTAMNYDYDAENHRFVQVQTGTGHFQLATTWENGVQVDVKEEVDSSKTIYHRYVDGWAYKYYTTDANGNDKQEVQLSDIDTSTSYIVDMNANEGNSWQSFTGFVTIETIIVEGKAHQKFYGYYEYVGPNNNGNYTYANGKFTRVEVGNGDYKFFPKEKYDSGKEYKISSNPSDPYIGQTFYKIAEVLHYYEFTNETDGYVYYEYESYNTFVNETLAKAYDLDTEAKRKNFHVVVCSITVEELNRYYSQSKKENEAESNNAGKWLDRADLIYMCSNSHEASFRSMISACYEDIEYQENGIIDYIGENDLTWASTMAVYEKVANGGESGERCALVADWRSIKAAYEEEHKDVGRYQFYYNKKFEINLLKCQDSVPTTGYLNNVYKLMVMLRSMDAEIFYSTFMSDYGEDGKNPAIAYNEELDTGYYKWAYDKAIEEGMSKQDAMDLAVYWSNKTFYPANPDGTEYTSAHYQNLKHDTTITYSINATFDNGGNTVTSNVFIFNNDTGFYGSFLSDGTNIGDFCKEFLDWLDDQLDDDGNVRTDETNAAVLEYLLGYQGGGGGNARPELNILEIEPCNEFWLTEEYVRIMLPKYKGKINIEQVTTAEFNGRIDTLKEDYDFIYIGDESTLLKDGDVFLDNDNTTYVYRKERQQVTAASGYSDVLSNPFGNTEFNTAASLDANKSKYTGSTVTVPGNDITDAKMKELKEYVEAGLPILVCDNVYTANASAIDSESNIKRLHNAVSDQICFVKVIYGANGTLQSLLGKDKPYISGAMPTQYVSTADDGSIVMGSYLGGTTLDFAPALADTKSNYATNNTYNYAIYVDLNGDGKFTKTSSQTTNECMKTGTIVADNATHAISLDIQSDDCKMLNDWNGAITWKLKVYDDAESACDSVTGVSAISASTKTTLNILQIYSDTNGWNIEEDMNDTSSLMYQYGVSGLKDYELNVTSVSLSQYIKMFNGVGLAFDNTSISTRIETNKLGAYDLVIVGGGENAENFDFKNGSTGSLDNLIYFMKSGKRVIFLQDTMIEDTVSGTTGNSCVAMREFTGMDRYGASTLDALWVKYGMSGLDSMTDEDQADALADFKTTYDATMKKKETTSYSRNGYTYAAVSAMSDASNIYLNGVRSVDAKDESYSTSASKINDGAVCVYPYCITVPNQANDVAMPVEVSGNKAQSFQLDLNASDTTVWYCLNDVYAPTGLYSVSPRDAANNYYLVTTDDAAFINLGNTTLTQDMQTQLFINTIIASYRKTYDPYIDVENGQKVNKNLYYVYDIDDDYDSEVKESGDYINIIFTPQNPNHTKAGDAYSTATVSASTIYTDEDTPTKIKIYNNDNGEITGEALTNDNGNAELKIGTTYIARYKKDTAASTAGKPKTITFTISDVDAHSGACTVKVITRNMYDMD